MPTWVLPQRAIDRDGGCRWMIEGARVISEHSQNAYQSSPSFPLNRRRNGFGQ